MLILSYKQCIHDYDFVIVIFNRSNKYFIIELNKSLQIQIKPVDSIDAINNFIRN